MKNLLIISILLLSIIPGKAVSQAPPMIKLDELKTLLSPTSDTTYVLNFWATWCKPCIKELPYFEQLHTNFKNKKVKVILVSLDFKRHFETQLIPFLNKNNLTSKVLVLDEPDANLWIDLVDPSWSGAIPATVVMNASKKERNFYEKEFTYVELENIVKPLISE